jgi:photosystem II stability/assembly factor-like uncharacterized protein
MISHRLCVGTIGEGMFRSTDGGATFRRACEGMFVECHVRALVAHPRDPRTYYLGSEMGLFKSTDGGDWWERLPAPLEGHEVWSILVLPADPDVILVGARPSRILRSADGGRTWSEPSVELVRECPRILYNRVTTLTADPVDPDTVWAGVEIDAVRRSRDRGQTWEAVGEGLSSRDIHALAVVPPRNGKPKRLLASTNNDLNVSTDDGATWTPLRVGSALPVPYYRGLAQRCDDPEKVLVGNGDFPPGSTGTVGLSDDGGATWRPARLPGPANSTVWNFAVHPADPKLIYASSVSGQVYRSTDGGEAWEKLAREFGEVRALAWAPG